MADKTKGDGDSSDKKKKKGVMNSLSSTVRGLKFMQKAQEKTIRNKIVEEENQRILASQWASSTSLGSSAFMDETGASASAARPPTFSGRRSFGNFNPDLEKATSTATTTSVATEEEKSIKDKTMAARFEKYVGMRGGGRRNAGSELSGSGEPARKKHKK